MSTVLFPGNGGDTRGKTSCSGPEIYPYDCDRLSPLNLSNVAGDGVVDGKQVVACFPSDLLKLARKSVGSF
jgi:hypothetical protein